MRTSEIFDGDTRYLVCRQDRAARNSGGVLILVPDSIASLPARIVSSLKIVFFSRISKSHRQLI